MVITFKSTPGGEGDYLTKFPLFESIDAVKTDGRIDDGKVRRELREWVDLGYITFGDDNHAVLSLAVEFLRQLTSVSQSSDKDAETRAHLGPQSKHDSIMEKRYARGQFAYTRVKITSNANGIRVRVSAENPKEVVGSAMKSVRDFAAYICRIFMYLKREIEKDVGRELIRLEGEGTNADIFDYADFIRLRRLELDRVDELNAKRSSCPNMRAGNLCSPSDFGCKCFARGFCEACRLPKQFESFEEFKEYQKK